MEGHLPSDQKKIIWRTDNVRGQSLKQGTDLTGTLLPTQKSISSFFARGTHREGWHVGLPVRHSTLISLSCHRPRAAILLLPCRDAPTGCCRHLREASLTFKRYKKSPTLLNFARSSKAWVRQVYRVDVRSRRRNDCVLNDCALTELLNSWPLELFYFGTYFLGELQFLHHLV